jgi:polar amino acid transport system substrate-binding protein
MTPDRAQHPGRPARLLAAALLCAATCLPLHAAEKLSLCFENKAVLPWRTTDQGGLNFELLKRVGAKLDVTFDYQLLPWKRCLAKLKANEVDGAFTVSFSDERRQYGAFPGGEVADIKKRMHFAGYYLIRKKGDRISWDGKRFHHVDGKISYFLGYSVGEQLREQQVAVDETSDSLYNVGRKILTGRVAGAAMMDSDMTVLMHGPLGPKLEVVSTPLVEKPYYLMLSNAMVKARPELAERIWKSIEEVRTGREYGKLVQAAGVEHAR